MSAPQGLWNADFLNANAARKYPLHEGAELWDTTHSFRIPDDFLVDLIWPTHPDALIDPTKFHVAGVAIFASGVVLTIGYNGTPIGSTIISSSGFVHNSTYLIQGTGEFSDSVGKVVIGALDNIINNAGAFVFGPTDAPIETTAIKPALRNVSALYLQNGTEVSDAINGDVVLRAGRNMQIRVVRGTGTDPDMIILDALDGTGLNEDCTCAENPDTPCIRTINGVGPDENGNLDLLPDDCILLTPNIAGHSIALKDKCCTPCCGCEELTVVRTTLENVSNQINALENLQQTIAGSLTNLEVVLAASGKQITGQV
jgi:hypothetical protein